jgi:DNA-binding beta-propeller fold protein YncE
VDHDLVGSRGLRAALAVVFCLALAPQAHAQPVLFGGTSGNNSGVLGTVNQTNANFTLLGDPTANGPLTGIAINSAGQMFGSNNIGGGSGGTSVLIRIDPATGLSLGTAGPIVDSGDNDDPLKVTDLAFQPGTDILFGLTGPADDAKEGNLYTINTATGAATLVGNTGLERGGLAFAPDGTLYVATVGDDTVPVIAKINPANAAVIGTPANLDQNGIDGLAVRPSDGVIFGTAAESDQLYTINPTSGAMSFIGDDNAPAALASLTFSPGGPGKTSTPALSPIGIIALCVALLACGSIMLVRRSRLS